ncbi:MAG: PGF-CTERM sorting domain-containing protein [Methanosarcinales archaeon]|nr:PGF-CTERM sorting domain-containing protein [Methanosarcinales archaeon]
MNTDLLMGSWKLYFPGIFVSVFICVHLWLSFFPSDLKWIPGFGLLITVTGLLTVGYLLLRRK